MEQLIKTRSLEVTWTSLARLPPHLTMIVDNLSERAGLAAATRHNCHN